MATVREHAKIRDISTRCFELFTRTSHAINDQETRTASAINDKFSRFRLWASNIGVFADAQLSLDFRVREADEIRGLFLCHLEIIECRLYQLNEVIPGRADDDSKPMGNESGKYTHTGFPDSINADKEPEPFQEWGFDELLDSIRHSIDWLQRLSNSTRKASAVKQNERAKDFKFEDYDGEEQLSENEVRNYYRGKVLELSPGLKDDWMIDRLADTMALRLRRVLYRRSRQVEWFFPHTKPPSLERRSTTPSSQAQQRPLPVSFEGIANPKATSNIIRNTAPGNNQATTLDQSAWRRERAQQKSEISRATSASTKDGNQLNIPPPPKSASSGEDFACPYCYMVLQSSVIKGKGKAWRKHVTLDLEPYICVFSNCETPSEIYPTKAEWLSHMKTSHRMRWRCLASGAGHLPFTSETAEDFEKHMMATHADGFRQEDLPFLTRISRQAISPTIECCPFCLDAHSGTTNLEDHVIQHLQEFSLHSIEIPAYFLPNCPEGQESIVLSADGDDRHTSDARTRSTVREARQEWKYPLTFEDNVVQYELTGARLEEYGDLPGMYIREQHEILDTAVLSTPGYESLAAFTFKRYHVDNIGALVRLLLDRRFIVPYEENADFVGRVDILHQIKQQFEHDQNKPLAETPSIRVALIGLGGAGKTQIALAYVYWVQLSCPHMSVFWVYASDAEHFSQSYLAIAKQYNIPGYDDPEADILLLVKIWLEQNDRCQWLMVIDDADSMHIFTEAPYGLARYIPECCHGSILITTRSSNTRSELTRGRPLIQVGNMSESETQQLLHRVKDEKVSTEEAAILSSRLGHLPLALVTAAAFLREKDISISDYITMLDNSDIAKAAGRVSVTSYLYEVAATLIFSFNSIEQQNPLASDILSLSSLFDRDAVPVVFISNYCSERKSTGSPTIPADTIEALGTLKAFSFISEANNTIRIHRLVQRERHNWLRSCGRFTEFAQHALKTISDIYPYGEYESRELCRRYLPHAYAVLENGGDGTVDEWRAKASLYHHMAGYFLYMGKWNDAEKSFDRATKLRRDFLGEKHPDTLDSMNQLAVVLNNQGKYREAGEMLRQVIEVRTEVLGADHPSTLNSMNNLAVVFGSQGKYKDAEEIHQRVLGIRATILGLEHPSTLVSLNNLGLILNSQGRYDEAENLQRQTLATRMEVLGSEHPSTLSSMNNLAVVLEKQGKHKESEKIHRQTLEMRMKVLGPHHPSIQESIDGLALVLEQQGKFDEAKKMRSDEPREL